MLAYHLRRGVSSTTLQDRQRCRSGFTLIELLVVISIISLLIAMLLPSIEKARESGEQVACQSNMRHMGIAQQTYIHEWDDWMPAYEAWYGDHNNSRIIVTGDDWHFHRKGVDLGAIINTYLAAGNDGFANIFLTNQGMVCHSFQGQADPDWPSQPLIPEKTGRAVGHGLASYGRNFWFMGWQYVIWGSPGSWVYRKFSEVPRPGDMISDADTGYSYKGKRHVGNYWPLINRDMEVGAANPLPEFRDELQYPIGGRHFKGANALLIDGHVEWETQIKWHRAGENGHRWDDGRVPKHNNW